MKASNRKSGMEVRQDTHISLFDEHDMPNEKKGNHYYYGKTGRFNQKKSSKIRPNFEIEEENTFDNYNKAQKVYSTE
jgi:hypothetical protein